MANDDQRDTTSADPHLLNQVDENKRSALRRFVIGAAYAVPAIASFSLAGLSATEAASYVSNVT
jgi:hypothetical protein